MTSQRDPDRMRNPAETRSMIDNDSAWGPIFGVVIIAGLALAALFFFLNSGDNTPARQTTSIEQRGGQPAPPPATTRRQ